MDAQTYEQISAPLRRNPKTAQAVIAANKVLTGLGYAIYPLLLVILAATNDPFLVRAFLVPAMAFALVTLLRVVINAPRPYETLPIQPIIQKDTQGKSFPSRHAFSMAIIALTWLAWCWPVGTLLLVATVGMATVRVMGGVHFPRDVLAGIACAVVAAVVGFLII
jgi:membrane-associated phospholipid phosphatase